MNAREAIRLAVRAARPPATPRPDVRRLARAFPPSALDAVDRFTEAATSAGSRVIRGARRDLRQLVAEHYPRVARTMSFCPEIPGVRASVSRLQDLADIDLLVCDAALGVAENGAVWLPMSCAPGRAASFLSANIAVVLDPQLIVDNLHMAYERLGSLSLSYGVLVAGPSKTADIEQALVIGAHGPYALTVFILDNSATGQ